MVQRERRAKKRKEEKVGANKQTRGGDREQAPVIVSHFCRTVLTFLICSTTRGGVHIFEDRFPFAGGALARPRASASCFFISSSDRGEVAEGREPKLRPPPVFFSWPVR